jgi:hypothetical protein
MSPAIPHGVVAEWNKSLERDFAKRSKLHAQTKALFLLWEDTSVERQRDAGSLKRVLAQRFRFEQNVFNIPKENSQEALQAHIQGFIASFNAESSLALIYYSGNGSIEQNRPFWQL